MARPQPHHQSRLRHLGSSAEPDAITRLRAELAEKTRRAEATLLSLDNLVSPLDWADGGDGFPGFGTWRFDRPADRATDRSHAPLNYLSEQEWRLQLALARDLCTRNHLALGFRDHVGAFVGPVQISFVMRGPAPGSAEEPTPNPSLKGGEQDLRNLVPFGVSEEASRAFTPSLQGGGRGVGSSSALLREVARAWDEWRELAEWGEGEHDREEECRRRLIVEGECTLRFFQGDAHTDGLPYVRHVEPELIRTPPGHSTLDEWGWGFLADTDDDEHVKALWQCHPQNVEQGEQVPASEWVHAKANVDRTIKRGLSDFFAVGEPLRKVLGLLDNLAHVARLQAAIAWWEQHPTATLAQVQSVIQAGADYSRVKLPPNGQGASQSVTNYEAGTVVATEAGRVVQPGPTSQPAGFAQVEEMVLRAVGFRWGCPSYFSGAAQDSFASVLVTGSPFVRITEARQEKVKGFAKAVAARVVAFCERSGRLPRGTSRFVRAVATARPVVIADAEKQARTFLSLYEKNCADPVEFIRARGGDPKVVAANIRAWQQKFAPQQPGGGSAGPPPGPTDPTAAPPGSAGGDGSSPAQEGRRVRESFNEADHPRDDHGRFVEKHEIEAAKTDPAKAAELRQRVTNPTERAKLDAMLGTGPASASGGGTATNPASEPGSAGSPGGPSGGPGGGGHGGGPQAPAAGGGPPPARKLSKADLTLPDAERHKKVLSLLPKKWTAQARKDATSTHAANGKKTAEITKHLDGLDTRDLYAIVHHYAQGKKGRLLGNWATTANEVLLNRLLKDGAGAKLQQSEAFDAITNFAALNYKVISGTDKKQDGFTSADARRVKAAMSELSPADRTKAFGRLTLLLDPNNTTDKGLYVYPDYGSARYQANKRGGEWPIRVLSLDDFQSDLENDPAALAEAVTRAVGKPELWDEAKKAMIRSNRSSREASLGIVGRDLQEAASEGDEAFDASVNKMVGGLPPNIRDKVVKQATTGMSNDEFDRWVEEEKKRRAGGATPPPAA